MQNDQQSMQQMVQNLIKDLNAQGIKVEGAAVLKLDSGNEKQVTEAIKRNINLPGFPVLAEINDQSQGQSQDQLRQESQEEKVAKQWWCKNCFNFGNFEERLQQFAGQFAYAAVEFFGKIYDIKFHKTLDGKETMMVNERKYTVDTNWNAQKIQEELNMAVVNKEFDKAQLLLSALNNIKNIN